MNRPNTQLNTDQTGDPTTTEQAFSIAEAADHLGLTSEAVRMRLKRGTLTGMKVDGHWVIYLPAPTKQPAPSDPTPTEHDQTTDQTAPEQPTKHDPTPPNAVIAIYEQLVKSQREEITFLRRELDTRNDELERRDVLLREALGRIPSLASGETRVDPPTASPTGQGEAEREKEGSDSLQPRSWWRRVLGVK